jgi:signal transduction histidine kinase
MGTKVVSFGLTLLFLGTSTFFVLGNNMLDVKYESLFEKKYENSQAFLVTYWNHAVFSTQQILDGDGTITEQVPWHYYVNNGKFIRTNTGVKDKAYYLDHSRAYFIIENEKVAYGNERFKQFLANTNGLHAITGNFQASNAIAYVSFPNAFIDQKQVEWNKHRKVAGYSVVLFAASVVISILLIGLLILGAGRRNGSEGLFLLPIDRIYTDVQLVLLAVFFRMWLSYANIYYANSGIWIQGTIVITVLLIIVCIATFGIVLLSFVRKVKAKKLLKDSLTYKLGFYLYDFIKSVFDGSRFEHYPATKSLFYRQTIFITSSVFLVLLTVIILTTPLQYPLIPPLIEIIILYWYVTGNKQTFEKIQSGLDQSLAEQVKAERMKVTLITNVSHDLKTPLTSIISYVDLLQKQPDLSETSRDYVNVLAMKADRLNHIVSDLFDLTKSSSGNMKIQAEELDLKTLLEQTLADMQPEISASTLGLKVQVPDGVVPVYSDGKLLYRVLQNVLDNALKYAMKGTRVFVDLAQQDVFAVIRIQNTAGYEMNFTAEEVMQRFTRGDESRSTEGSGLGLSIAESFTRVCGGQFSIELDGDQFKITIRFPIHNLI